MVVKKSLPVYLVAVFLALFQLLITRDTMPNADSFRILVPSVITVAFIVVIWKANERQLAQEAMSTTASRPFFQLLPGLAGNLVVIGSLAITLSYLVVSVREPFKESIIWMYPLRFLLTDTLVLAIQYSIWSAQQVQRYQLENLLLQKNNTDARFDLLKQQISPHFLFNALSISTSLIKNQPEEARHYLLRLADFLRTTLTSAKKSNSLRDELVISTNYVALQQMRYGTALHYAQTIPDTSQQKHLPFFTLVTLVENAIKHNILTSELPLRIKVLVEGEYLVVKNNYQPKPTLPSTGIGLPNLSQRSQLLAGEPISIRQASDAFEVRVKLFAYASADN